MQVKTALREICRTFQPGIRLTAHQSLMFTDLPAEDRSRSSKKFCTGTA